MNIIIFFLSFNSVPLHGVAAVDDLFDPFGMGASSGVGSSLSSSRQASGPDLIGDLLGSDSSGTSEFPSAAPNNPPSASNASLFELSKHASLGDHCQCNITLVLKKVSFA